MKHALLLSRGMPDYYKNLIIIFLKTEIINRPFSKMAATNLNELKLNWMKNWYQHWNEHLYFSHLTKFQHIRCYISLGNVRWNLTNLQTFVWLGVYVIPSVIQTSINFDFSTYIFSADIKPDMLKLCRVTKVKVLFLVLVYVLNLMI